jgi:hypothetical protein
MKDLHMTAVEFLHSEYKKILGEIEIDIQDAFKIADFLEQAKEMFEQQIIEAVTFGQNNHTVMIQADLEIAEQYYNETYGK